MPVAKGWIGGQEVEVLRDTGCSSAVVKAELVKEGELTGTRRRCTLIDGTSREFGVARVEVNTPFYSGKLEALVMPSLLYDLIIGNVLGARGPCDPDPLFAETAAVETRSQMQKRSKGVKPLVTPAQREGISASPEDLKKAQRDDKSLAKLFELAGAVEEKEVRGGTVRFLIKKKRGAAVSGFHQRQDGQVDIPVGSHDEVQGDGHVHGPRGTDGRPFRIGQDRR